MSPEPNASRTIPALGTEPMTADAHCPQPIPTGTTMTVGITGSSWFCVGTRQGGRVSGDAAKSHRLPVQYF